MSKYTAYKTLRCEPAWKERLHLLAGGKRKRDTYIRDVIDLLYVDKTLRGLVNGKLEVKRERN